MAWIDKLVGRSPIGPMQEHMRSAVACAHQILPLVETGITQLTPSRGFAAQLAAATTIVLASRMAGLP